LARHSTASGRVAAHWARLVSLEFVHEQVVQPVAQAAEGVGDAQTLAQDLAGHGRELRAEQKALFALQAAQIAQERPGDLHAGRKTIGRRKDRLIADVGGGGGLEGGVGRFRRLGAAAAALGQQAFGQAGLVAVGRVRQAVEQPGGVAFGQEVGEMRGAVEVRRLDLVPQALQRPAHLVVGQGQQVGHALLVRAQLPALGGGFGEQQPGQPDEALAQGILKPEARLVLMLDQRAHGLGEERRLGAARLAAGQEAGVQRAQGLLFVEHGLEVRRQALIQGEEPHEQAEQAVDGADAEVLRMAQDVLEQRLGPLGRKPRARTRHVAQGPSFERAQNAFAHFGRGLVGEGHGQDLRPGVAPLGRTGRRAGAGDASGLVRRARQQLQEAQGQGIGLARPRRGPELLEGRRHAAALLGDGLIRVGLAPAADDGEQHRRQNQRAADVAGGVEAFAPPDIGDGRAEHGFEGGHDGRARGRKHAQAGVIDAVGPVGGGRGQDDSDSHACGVLGAEGHEGENAQAAHGQGVEEERGRGVPPQIAFAEDVIRRVAEAGDQAADDARQVHRAEAPAADDRGAEAHAGHAGQGHAQGHELVRIHPLAEHEPSQQRHPGRGGVRAAPRPWPRRPC